MIHERKFLWAVWFTRFAMLFSILAGFFAGYNSAFVENDIGESFGYVAGALISCMFFFSSFIWFRLYVRENQLKKQLSEKFELTGTLTEEKSMINGVRPSIEYWAVFLITLVVILYHVLSANKADSDSNYPKLYLHLVFAVGIMFIFNVFISVYFIDGAFKKLQGLISQLPKDHTEGE